MLFSLGLRGFTDRVVVKTELHIHVPLTSEDTCSHVIGRGGEEGGLIN